jgi:hypothetical protein
MADFYFDTEINFATILTMSSFLYLFTSLVNTLQVL